MTHQSKRLYSVYIYFRHWFSVRHFGFPFRI